VRVGRTLTSGWYLHYLVKMVRSTIEVKRVDGQGRIMIPPSLREVSGIEKEVMFTGQIGSFHLWDARAWDDNQKADREEAKRLVQSGTIRLKM